MFGKVRFYGDTVTMTGSIPQFISIPSFTAHEREKKERKEMSIKKLIRLAASQNTVIQV